MTISDLLSRLDEAGSRVKQSGAGYICRCPAHEDNFPSLSINEGDDGRILLKCFAGCTTKDVCDSLGISLKDLMPENDWQPGRRRSKQPSTAPRTKVVAKTARPNPPTSKSSAPSKGGKQECGNKKPVRSWRTLKDAVKELRPTTVYTYHDASGNELGAVFRTDNAEGKDIRQLVNDGGAWKFGGIPKPHPLYRLPELLKAETVFVAEGEQCALALAELGLCSTTSIGGSQNAKSSDWSVLSGKDAVICLDRDEPGERYCDDVLDAIGNIARSVRVVRLESLEGQTPKGFDIYDWIEQNRHLNPNSSDPELVAELQRLTQSGELIEPEQEGLRWKPFPVDALPEPLRSLVIEGAAAIGCDECYIALPAIAMLASCIGNTRRLEVKQGWHVPPILWTVIVGESGTAKTPALKLALRPLKELQGKAFEQAKNSQAEYEAQNAAYRRDLIRWERSKEEDGEPPTKPLEPSVTRYIISDTTVEGLAPVLLNNPRGVLLARDELAGWLGSFDRYSKGAGDSAHWLSMHTAESVYIDRKTGPVKSVYIPQAAVCITGGIQPGILDRALSPEHRESGLAARLLIASPPRRAKRWSDRELPHRVSHEMTDVVETLLGFLPCSPEGEPWRPHLVRLTAQAREQWIAFYDEHAAEQAAVDGELASAYSKLEEAAARLALVVHCVRVAAGDQEVKPLDLDANSMRCGIELARWFAHEYRRYVERSLSGAEEPSREQAMLVSWIRSKGGSVSERDCRRGPRWLRTPGKAEAALAELVKAELGDWHTVGSGAEGGRPVRKFVLREVATRRHGDTTPKNNGKTEVVSPEGGQK